MVTFLSFVESNTRRRTRRGRGGGEQGEEEKERRRVKRGRNEKKRVWKILKSQCRRLKEESAGKVSLKDPYILLSPAVGIKQPF